MTAVWLALAVTLASALLVGCGSQATAPGGTLSVMKEPDTIAVPLQPARDLYATIRLTVKDRFAHAESLCLTGKLPAATCRQVALDRQAAQQLDFEINRSLTSPKATLDVEKIKRVLELSAKLIGAAL